MSGWTEREYGDVKIKHHSTSSTVEVIITSEEEVEQGKMEKVVETVWLDYGTFSDLKKVLSQVDFP